MKKTEVNVMTVGKNTLKPDTDVIKYEGANDVLFWRTSGNVANPDCKLIVADSTWVLYRKNGVTQNVFTEGMYPIFETVKKGFLGFGRKVDAIDVDMIFMNSRVKSKADWGTQNPPAVKEPLTGRSVHVRANGEYEVRVANPKKFYEELIGNDQFFDLDALAERLGVRLRMFINDTIVQAIYRANADLPNLDNYAVQITEILAPRIDKIFRDEYGLEVCSFSVATIQADKNDLQLVEDDLAARRREIKEKEAAEALARELETLERKEREEEERQRRLAEEREDKLYERSKEQDELAFHRLMALKQLEMADRAKYYEVMDILEKRRVAGAPTGRPSAAGRFCPTCGAPFNNGDTFCVGCGGRLPGTKTVCKHCGRELDGTAKFCPSCGNKL